MADAVGAFGGGLVRIGLSAQLGIADGPRIFVKASDVGYK